ncbi:GSCOCG00002995001-RA-CDS [Cotesia congregata]|nr:GSCOCG00002995001-RA-CDS [Cotesia congregata]
MVSGEGPRDDPTPTPAVRNSRLATLSALDIVAGDILPRGPPSLRRDGGRGIIIEPVGVDDADCLGGKAGVMSPTSENKSPSVVSK